MTRRISRFLALSPADRRLLVRAAVMQPLLRLALRVAGIARCHAGLGRLGPLPPAAVKPAMHGAEAEARRVARLVRAAGVQGLLDPNCLVESLTLWWLLRSRGIESEVRIGVRRIGDGLEAHAWVERGGTVVSAGQEGTGRFAPLAGSPDILRHAGRRAS